MITKEGLPGREIKIQVQDFLAKFRYNEVKPVIMGRIMEEMNEIVRTTLEFLENQTKITYDDPVLNLDIQNQVKRFDAFNEKYNALIERNKNHEEQKAKADKIEEKHNTLESKIEEIKQLIDTEKDKSKQLKAEYEKCSHQLKQWKLVLQEIETRHTENLANYRIHFAANDALLQSILKFDGNAQEHMEAISDNIKRKLNEFDNILAEFIKNRQDIPIHEFEHQWSELIDNLQ